MARSGKIRILLLQGERIVREGLRALFHRQPDLEVVAESGRGAEASELIDGLAPDVVVVSIIAPGASSIAAIRQICQERPAAKVIALSAFSHRLFLGEALRAGVRGYVTMQSDFDELLEAIRTVASGLTYLCCAVRGQVLADYARAGRDDRDSSQTALTERERMILRLLGDGKTSKEIAKTQELSSKTIDACRRRLMRKLHVDSMAGLVKCAILMEMTAASP